MDDSSLHPTETSTGTGATQSAQLGVERICPTCERSYSEQLTRCPEDETLLIIVGEDIDPLVGKTIRDSLTLRKRIGSGGMGVVYTAWQHSVGREVVVKVMNSRINRDAAAAKRFIREANLASQLSHPHVVTIHDFGQDEDRLLYIVMERLDGVSLRDALRSGESFDLRQIERMVSQLCDALEAAHAISIVHRDLKPANIMLLRKPGVRDFLKVLDFGIAKSLDGDHTTITHSHAILGTPAYIPPEVALSNSSDARGDLYALGVIMYQLLAGRLPFSATDARTMISMHATESVPALPDHVPAAVAQVVYRLLEKAPDDRIQTASKVREAFARAVSGGAGAMSQPVAPAQRMGAITTTTTNNNDELTATTPATPRAREQMLANAATVLDTPGDDTARIGPRGTRPYLLIAAALVVVGVGALFVVRGLGGADSHADRSTPAPLQPTGRGLAEPADAAVTARKRPAHDAAATTALSNTVRISIKARRARIYIDGKPHGWSSVSIRVPRGSHTHYVRVVRSGYREWSKRVQADRDRDLQPALRRIKPRTPRPGPDTEKSKPPQDPDGPWLGP